MVILLTGADGFIGCHLVRALTAAGHEPVCAVRNPAASARNLKLRYIQVDFTRDFNASDWLPRLGGIDAVVNTVGILRERDHQTFEAVHVRAPRALFAACAAVGVRVVHLSALGADVDATTRYHVSKRTADEILLKLCDSAVVTQPSLVYGSGGASATFFTRLASLPLIPLPEGGNQWVQPIHIDDLVAALVKLIEQDSYRQCRIALVGPQPITLHDFVANLRRAMSLGSGVFIPVPGRVMNLAARVGDILPGSLLNTDTLRMLRHGNSAHTGAIRRLLGRPLKSVSAFIAPDEADGVRLAAQLGWLLPMLRATIALVWILTGIVSLGVYPVEQSYALLARVGITGWMAGIALYGAALLDIIFGIAIFIVKRRRFLWFAQAAVITAYTAIITLKLPEFWLHPYGPISKNLPMLAAIWMLHELEKH